MQDPTPNPALKDPELLVGDWNLEIDLPSDLPTAARGHVSFKWLEGGAFLVMRVGVEWEAPSGSVAIIGHDDASETYSTLYFDARGASRIYQMTLNDDVWTQWRTAPGFSQRFTGTFSADRAPITARWEKSSDGAHWEHDFDLIYRRTS